MSQRAHQTFSPVHYLHSKYTEKHTFRNEPDRYNVLNARLHGMPQLGPDPFVPLRSHVGLQPLQTVHPLHVALDGGGAGDGLAALGQEPAPLSVPQPLALVPA